MDDVVGMIAIHRDAGQAACRGLTEHLRMSLDEAWKQEDIGIPHFLSKLGPRQMAEERHVAATELFCKRHAGLQLLALSDHPETDVRPPLRFGDEHIRTFPPLEGSGIQDGDRRILCWQIVGKKYRRVDTAVNCFR